MKSDKKKLLLCLLFFTILAVITFRCVWPADHVFATSDLNIGRLAAIKSSIPDALSGGCSVTPVLGGSGYSSPRFFNLVLALLPLSIFANVFYGLVLVGGSISMLWFLRLWSRSWTASVFGTLIGFWVNSIMLATVGHAYKMEVLVFSVLSLCLIEKAIRAASTRKAVGFSILAGLSVGIMMIEQQDVALLAGLFVGPYTLFRLIQVHRKAFLRWGAVLIPVGVIAVLLSGNTIVKSYKRNIAGAASVQQGQGEDKWNYITQWSAVPEEWPDLIALGWGGWSSNNPEGPYWGKLGQSAEWESTGKGFRNFKLNSVYFGMIPFLLGAFGLVAAMKNRRSEEGAAILFWSIAGLIGFWLAFGKYSLLYKLFYQLPMVSNIRAPIKFLDNFQICLAIVGAYGLDYLIGKGKGSVWAKSLWIASAAFGAAMLLAGLKIITFPSRQLARFSKMGYEPYAELMVRNMSNAWFHTALLTLLCAGLVFVVWKGFKWSKWVSLAFIVAIMGDSLVLTSHHFKATDIAPLKKGNVVTNYLKEHQGNERTFLLDQTGIYNQWLASDASYHGLRFFNIWQMPRMPKEYKEYLGKVGRNQIRLWELSAIKYVAAPAAIMQQFQQNPELGKRFKPILNYQVPTAQGMRPDVLLEFQGSIPRFALFQNWESLPLEEHCNRLVSGQHDPQSGILIVPEAGMASKVGGGNFHPLTADTSRKGAVLEVNTESPSIVRFSQRYEPNNWEVLVDGEKAELIRVDYLCMGVSVPPGIHIVEFRVISRYGRLLLVLIVFIGSILMGLIFILTGGKGSLAQEHFRGGE